MIMSWLTKDADISLRPVVDGQIHLRAAVTGTVEAAAPRREN